MYRVHTKLSVNGSVVDEYDSVLGFRWFEFNKEVGFKLNGENVKLNGVCMHHDQGALGSAAYYDAVYRQLSIMKDMGVNAVRITHNPSNKQYLEMSTGQKRRLHLALALICDPDIVFLDEPTAGLDVEGRISLHRYIRELKARGKTIVLATHDMAEVESLCDSIAILRDGRIAFAGTVIELTEKIGKHYNIQIRTDQGTETYGTGDIVASLTAILKSYQEKNAVIQDIRVDRGSLEQHFLKIAKGE